jgi:hypothetical protein
VKKTFTATPFQDSFGLSHSFGRLKILAQISLLASPNTGEFYSSSCLNAGVAVAASHWLLLVSKNAIKGTTNASWVQNSFKKKI